MLGDFGRAQRQIRGNPGAAQIGDETQRFGALGLVGYNHKNIAVGGVALEPDFQLHRSVRRFLNEVANDIVAHRKAGGGHIHRTVGNG